MNSCYRTTITTLLTSALIGAFIGSGITIQPVHAAKQQVMLAPQNEQQAQAQQLALQGQELLKGNKPFRARPLLEQAVGLWSEPHLLFTLGICYTEIGEFPKAIEAYESALRLDPKMTDCFNNIASCYQLMGQPQQAIGFFQTYLKRHPGSEEVGRVKGMIAALSKSASRQVQSDPNSSDYLQSVMPNGRMERWKQNRMPIKVFISSGTDEQGNPVPGFRDYYNEMLLDAFACWVRASNNKLAYTLVDTASAADIVCSWTNQRDFLRGNGNSAEQGVARVASRGRPNSNESEIIQVRVIILIVDPEGKKNISDEDMKKTCLHELGHALGFGGHSTNNKDVMFYSESPTVWASLTKRDKATMARLYSDYSTASASTTYSALGGQMPYYSQPLPQAPPGYQPTSTGYPSAQPAPYAPQPYYAQQPSMPAYGQPAPGYNQPNYGQPPASYAPTPYAQAQPNYGQPPAYGQPYYGQPPNGPSYSPAPSAVPPWAQPRP